MIHECAQEAHLFKQFTTHITPDNCSFLQPHFAEKENKAQVGEANSYKATWSMVLLRGKMKIRGPNYVASTVSSQINWLLGNEPLFSPFYKTFFFINLGEKLEAQSGFNEKQFYYF